MPTNYLQNQVTGPGDSANCAGERPNLARRFDKCTVPPTPSPNVSFPAGAVKVYGWDDMEFNDPHRYFRGFTGLSNATPTKTSACWSTARSGPMAAACASSRSLTRQGGHPFANAGPSASDRGSSGRGR